MGQSQEAYQLNEQGLRAASLGDPAAAERLYHQSMDIWSKLGPDYRAHLGTTEYNLGQTLCAMGRRREALPILEDAVHLLRDTVGIRHIHTLAAVNFLGALQMMLGNTERAGVLFHEALPVERELYPKDEQLSLTLGGLSGYLVRYGKLEEALPLAEEALSIALAANSEESAEVALAYANVATVHKWSHHYDRALPLYRKSLSIYQKAAGPEHPRTAGVLMEIGLIEMEDGNYTLANRDIVHGLAIVNREPGWVFERWIGESDLGTLRFRQGKYEEAARLLSDSLTLQQQAGIRAGRDLAVTIEQLAKVREKQRRFDDARSLRDQAATMVSTFH